MSNNMPAKDVRTLGYVLRRTNYGEADRIINIITPLGKISAIARGVRKARSKLAGGIEMFSLTDFNIHLGKGELGVVTSAKMMKYYGEILKDFEKMELAGMILKKISQVAENSDSSEYFAIVDQCLAGLNDGMRVELVEGWFLINVMKEMGEEMNLYRDVVGEKLRAEERYTWDGGQAAFARDNQGEFGANEIKILRLMMADLKIVRRVKMDEGQMAKILSLIRMVARV